MNRWKPLLMCSFLLLFLPRFIAFFVFSSGASAFASAIRSGAMNGGNLLDILTSLVGTMLKVPMLVTFAAVLIAVGGVLALAHMCWDYFEQQPSTLQNAVGRGFLTLGRKGFGAFVMLVLIVMPTSVLTILRVIVLCLLVMLPIELAAGHQGGIRSVINALFLKYAAKTPIGRWPIFSNMMTVGGTALSIVFLSQIGLIYLSDADIVMNMTAGKWIETVHLWGGGSVSLASLTQHILELILDSTMIAITLPFVAALRYFAQKSTFTAAT
jgi:hypothetical protein